jgi:hypothetical protein
MEKRTLKFSTLKELTDFSKTLASGFLINTKNLTLTANISDLQLTIAMDMHKALPIETTEKVFSYDLV